MKSLFLLLVLITTFNVNAQHNSNHDENRIRSIPPATLPDSVELDRLHDELIESKNNLIYSPLLMLEYFSKILPPIRYESHVYRYEEAIDVYSEIEIASYELTQLYIAKHIDDTPLSDEALFIKTRILNDATRTVDRVAVKLKNIVEIIRNRMELEQS